MTPDLEARLREMAEEWFSQKIAPPHDDYDTRYRLSLMVLLREVAALAAQEQREQDARIAERHAIPGHLVGTSVAVGIAAAIRAATPERQKLYCETTDYLSDLDDGLRVNRPERSE